MKKITLVLLAALLLTAPVAAQDTEPLVTNTPVVTETPAEPPVGTPALNPDTAISISTLVYGIIIAVLGGGTVAVVINRFGSNKANLDALEKLYQSASPETQQLIRERFEELEGIVKRLLDMADRATDGKPNDAAAS